MLAAGVLTCLVPAPKHQQLCLLGQAELVLCAAMGWSHTWACHACAYLFAYSNRPSCSGPKASTSGAQLAAVQELLHDGEGQLLRKADCVA